MIKIVGLVTGKVYVTGSRSDCFRKLQKKYPYKIAKEKMVTNDAVYPEPLVVVGA